LRNGPVCTRGLKQRSEITELLIERKFNQVTSIGCTVHMYFVAFEISDKTS